jgi:23S rRNA (cytidine1920-2'-O)/16S rRNA (cytidine1409-2'-O)-methyltransferase
MDAAWRLPPPPLRRDEELYTTGVSLTQNHRIHTEQTSLRLDQALVQRGLAETRSKARDLIIRRLVAVAGQVAVKPSLLVSADMLVQVAADHVAYVSRGAEKLVAALDAFKFDPAGRTCLDIGASTGGFSEILLRRGAVRVHAVDVGRGQLHASLKSDPRIVSHEATDARALSLALVPEPITAIVADVSFISLTKALPAALALAAPGCWLAALVKPQFEAGRDAVGKGGIVRDEAARQRVLSEIHSWLAAQPGWRVIGTCPSPILGGDGNQEFLIGASTS